MLIVAPGSIVRVGPHQLVTDDPEVLRRMSAVRSPYRRSNWYDGIRLESDYDHVLSERDENRHNKLRAKMAAGVSSQKFLKQISARLIYQVLGQRERASRRVGRCQYY
jgi:hypothetical protein